MEDPRRSSSSASLIELRQSSLPNRKDIVIDLEISLENPEIQNETNRPSSQTTESITRSSEAINNSNISTAKQSSPETKTATVIIKKRTSWMNPNSSLILLIHVKFYHNPIFIFTLSILSALIFVVMPSTNYWLNSLVRLQWWAVICLCAFVEIMYVCVPEVSDTTYINGWIFGVLAAPIIHIIAYFTPAQNNFELNTLAVAYAQAILVLIYGYEALYVLPQKIKSSSKKSHEDKLSSNLSSSHSIDDKSQTFNHPEQLKVVDIEEKRVSDAVSTTAVIGDQDILTHSKSFTSFSQTDGGGYHEEFEEDDEEYGDDYHQKESSHNPIIQYVHQSLSAMTLQNINALNNKQKQLSKRRSRSSTMSSFHDSISTVGSSYGALFDTLEAMTEFDMNQLDIISTRSSQDNQDRPAISNEISITRKMWMKINFKRLKKKQKEIRIQELNQSMYEGGQPNDLSTGDRIIIPTSKEGFKEANRSYSKNYEIQQSIQNRTCWVEFWALFLPKFYYQRWGIDTGVVMGSQTALWYYGALFNCCWLGYYTLLQYFTVFFNTFAGSATPFQVGVLFFFYVIGGSTLRAFVKRLSLNIDRLKRDSVSMYFIGEVLCLFLYYTFYRVLFESITTWSFFFVLQGLHLASEWILYPLRASKKFYDFADKLSDKNFCTRILRMAINAQGLNHRDWLLLIALDFGIRCLVLVSSAVGIGAIIIIIDVVPWVQNSLRQSQMNEENTIGFIAVSLVLEILNAILMHQLFFQPQEVNIGKMVLHCFQNTRFAYMSGLIAGILFINPIYAFTISSQQER